MQTQHICSGLSTTPTPAMLSDTGAACRNSNQEERRHTPMLTLPPVPSSVCEDSCLHSTRLRCSVVSETSMSFSSPPHCNTTLCKHNHPRKHREAYTPRQGQREKEVILQRISKAIIWPSACTGNIFLWRLTTFKNACVVVIPKGQIKRLH